MQGHNAWIKRGFDEGLFLVVGSLQPNLDCGILALNMSFLDLRDRVNDVESAT